MKPKAPHANCAECPLRDRPFVPPQKVVGAKFAVVGEAPGREEVKRGRPFIGKSGQLLGAVLEEQGFNKDELHVTNAVLCHPQNNDTPSAEAIACCNARLLHELKEARVERVLASGAVASNAVCAEAVDKITKVRGKVLRGKGDFTVKVGLHPAYILRQPSQLEDFRRDIRTVLENRRPAKTEYVVIDSLSHLQRLIDSGELVGATISYDLETTSLEPHKAKILCANFSMDDDTAFIVAGDALFGLSGLFEMDSVDWVAWNAKYDNKVLLANGITPPAPYHDAMQMHYTLQETKGHGLKKVACDELGIEDWEDELKSLLPKRQKKVETHETDAVREDSDGGYANIPTSVLYKYSAIDADVTRQLYFKIGSRMDSVCKGLYKNTLMPMLNLLTDMEHEGFRIDRELLLSTIDAYWQKRNILLAEMAIITGRPEFNPNSPKQVGDVLFKQFGLPPVKQTPTGGESTDDFVLTVLKQQFPDEDILDKLTKFKQLTKILGTYLEPMRDNSLKDDNGDYRLYPDLMLHGTVSGRLAGGIWLTWPRPKTNEYTGVLRKLILADRGHQLVIADFDQCELRVVTCDAQDERFRDIFLAGGDPHADTADALYGPEWRDKHNADEWRTTGKTTNFAKLYGAGPNKIAETAGVSRSAGEQMSAAFDKAHPWLVQYFKRVHEQVRTEGFVESKFGRRRRFELITDDNWEDIKRESGNWKVQSPANDINYKAALKVKARLPYARTRLLVHDSILASVPEDKVLEARRAISDYGAEAGREYSDYVPFSMETKVGSSWGTATK